MLAPGDLHHQCDREFTHAAAEDHQIPKSLAEHAVGTTRATLKVGVTSSLTVIMHQAEAQPYVGQNE